MTARVPLYSTAQPDAVGASRAWASTSTGMPATFRMSRAVRDPSADAGPHAISCPTVTLGPATGLIGPGVSISAETRVTAASGGPETATVWLGASRSRHTCSRKAGSTDMAYTWSQGAENSCRAVSCMRAILADRTWRFSCEKGL